MPKTADPRAAVLLTWLAFRTILELPDEDAIARLPVDKELIEVAHDLPLA